MRNFIDECNALVTIPVPKGWVSRRLLMRAAEYLIAHASHEDYEVKEQLRNYVKKLR